MNRPLEWNEKLPDGGKRRVRVTFFSAMIKWQFQIQGEAWHYDTPPSLTDWEQLLDEVQRRHQRRRATQKELELTEAGYRLALKNAPAKPAPDSEE